MRPGLEKVIRRVGEDAQYVMDTSATAKQVLDSLVVELTPVVMAYKMRGVVPSLQALSSAAAKLTAIVAASMEVKNVFPADNSKDLQSQEERKPMR